MKDIFPSLKFSVIVPAPPGMKAVPSIEALKGSAVDPENLEVILALGTSPSRQRNLAAHMATGDVLVFLDSDSLPCPDMFHRIAEALRAGYSAVGGPSLTPRRDSPFGRAVASVFASPFGGASVRARYTSNGVLRDATENDLILCNLAIRREVFIATDGFNDELYPNEENEFLNRISREGHRLGYSPSMCVFRNQRRNLALFAMQVFNYGRGRAEQVFVCPEDLTIDRLAPAALALLLLTAPFMRGRAGRAAAGTLGLYGLLCAAAGRHALEMDPAISSSRISAIAEETSLPDCYGTLPRASLFPIMHAGYGLGFLWGALLCSAGLKQRREGHVGIRRVKTFGNGWDPRQEERP